MAEIERDIHPGEELRRLLEELVPYHPTEQQSFVTRLDRLARSEGELGRTMYCAAIDYLLRRLVRTAQYYNRVLAREGLPDASLWHKLRVFVRNELDVPVHRQERLITLLFACVRTSKRAVTQRTKDRIRRRAARQGILRCYLCGQVVSDTPNLSTSATVDHRWPQSLGGPSDDPNNLFVACGRCNEAKAESLRAEDFHYEKMALEVDAEDGDSFWRSFEYDFRIAVSLRHNGCCYQCGRPLWQSGEVRYARLNLQDAWHFLNVAVFCAEHAPE